MSYHIVSVDSPQCALSCRDGQLTCKADGVERRLPLEDVASVIITSFSANIHSHLLLEAAKHGVALILCEAFKPVSLVLPANRSTDTLLSRALLRLSERTRALLWQKTVDAKCQNQFALAAHLAPDHPRLEALRQAAFGMKPHKEALCAKTFWHIFGAALACEEFRREPGGGRKPGADSPARPSATLSHPVGEAPVGAGEPPTMDARAPGGAGSAATKPPAEESRGRLNTLLNYGYAVLLSTVLQKLFGVGLDPTFGLSHALRERSTPLAYDLMEPFRPCVDWRVSQWVTAHPNRGEWQVSKEFRRWVTAFPLERVEYLDLDLEIQGCIEGVVRGFRRAVLAGQARFYRPWTPRNTKWAGSS